MSLVDPPLHEVINALSGKQAPIPARVLAFFADTVAQRWAELTRVPTLLGQVLPSIVRARLTGTEAIEVALAQQARRRPSAPAILFEEHRLTFSELDQRVTRAALWLRERGIRSGDVVALTGQNSLNGVSLLLGASRLGAKVALLGAELEGPFLDHALQRVAPRALFFEAGTGKNPTLSRVPLEAIEYGGPNFDSALAALPASRELAVPKHSGDDDFAYVYTSGTTGPTKAARVSHRRSLTAATAFGRLVHRIGPGDVLYSALPVNHASGLLLGLGACVVTGAALALRRRFSASAFLSDVRRYEATVFLYIGELPRALLAQPETERDREHSLRLAVGNGLSEGIWERFQERFGISKVAEFYAATEFPGAIVNVTNKVGSVGHIPLERRRGYRLVRVDVETGELVRDARGRALESRPGEPGELVLRLRPKPTRATGDYSGYVGEKRESGARIARDLFRPGDVYCRSGDLLRRDRAGGYWFVDRLGDSFRFKGENVSSREVEAALSGIPGVNAVAVVGVHVPGVDGKPPLAVLAVADSLDFGEFEVRVQQLPKAARPCFIRLVSELAWTASMKVKKRQLAQEGVDPERVEDRLYIGNGARYEPLTRAVYRRLTEGELRL